MTLLLLTTSHEKRVNLSSVVGISLESSAALSNGSMPATTSLSSISAVAASLVASSDPIASIILTSASIGASISNGTKRGESSVSSECLLISSIYQGTRRGVLDVSFTTNMSITFPGRQYGSTGITSGVVRSGSGGTPTASGGRS